MFNKPYYRIGEIARILGVETHVIRYWESEFAILKPLRAPSGQRLYHISHLNLLKLIKELLYEQGYTIAGAKKALAQQLAPSPADSEPVPPGLSPDSLHQELKDLINILK
jgi:DNA-binding transcriptional MerR regulator